MPRPAALRSPQSILDALSDTSNQFDVRWNGLGIDCDPDHIVGAFDIWAAMWSRPMDIAFRDWMHDRRRYDFDEQTPFDDVKSILVAPLRVTARLMLWLKNAGQLETSVQGGLERCAELKRIHRHQELAYSYLLTEHCASITSNPQLEAEAEDVTELNFKMHLFESDADRSSHQNLLLYVLALLEQRQYRKFEDGCYEELRLSPHQPLYAWQRVMSISDFISENVQKELDYRMWKNLTNTPHSSIDCAKHIETHSEAEFPMLNRRRTLFAFKNGLYDIEQNAFFPFDDPDRWTEISERAVDDVRAWRPGFEGRAPSRKDAAIKYFDETFDVDVDAIRSSEHEAAQALIGAIPTPEFDGILRDQNFEPDTMRWLWALLGRCLYDVGHIDGWQVLLFIKGIAGSGKSTIATIFKAFYPDDLVGVISHDTVTCVNRAIRLLCACDGCCCAAGWHRCTTKTLSCATGARRVRSFGATWSR